MSIDEFVEDDTNVEEVEKAPGVRRVRNVRYWSNFFINAAPGVPLTVPPLVPKPQYRNSYQKQINKPEPRSRFSVPPKLERPARREKYHGFNQAIEAIDKDDGYIDLRRFQQVLVGIKAAQEANQLDTEEYSNLVRRLDQLRRRTNEEGRLQAARPRPRTERAPQPRSEGQRETRPRVEREPRPRVERERPEPEPRPEPESRPQAEREARPRAERRTERAEPEPTPETPRQTFDRIVGETTDPDTINNAFEQYAATLGNSEADRANRAIARDVARQRVAFGDNADARAMMDTIEGADTRELRDLRFDLDESDFSDEAKNELRRAMGRRSSELRRLPQPEPEPELSPEEVSQREYAQAVQQYREQISSATTAFELDERRTELNDFLSNNEDQVTDDDLNEIREAIKRTRDGFGEDLGFSSTTEARDFLQEVTQDDDEDYLGFIEQEDITGLRELIDAWNQPDNREDPLVADASIVVAQAELRRRMSTSDRDADRAFRPQNEVEVVPEEDRWVNLLDFTYKTPDEASAALARVKGEITKAFNDSVEAMKELDRVKSERDGRLRVFDGATFRTNVNYQGGGKFDVTLAASDSRGSRMYYMTRNIDINDGSVYNSYLSIATQYRDRGIASAANAHMVNEYRKQGFNKITVEANIDVGAYTWASQGYDWDRSHYGANLHGFVNSQLNKQVSTMFGQTNNMTHVAASHMTGVYNGNTSDMPKLSVRPNPSMWDTAESISQARDSLEDYISKMDAWIDSRPDLPKTKDDAGNDLGMDIDIRSDWDEVKNMYRRLYDPVNVIKRENGRLVLADSYPTPNELSQMGRKAHHVNNKDAFWAAKSALAEDTVDWRGEAQLQRGEQ